MNPQRLRLACELLCARHAPALLVGGLLLAVGAWLAGVTLPAQAEARARLQREARLPPAPPAAVAADPLAAFRAVLSPDAQKTEIARALWQAAQAAALAPQRVDYHSGQPLPGGFARFELSLPVSGPPAAIRQFAFALLERYPGLALEKIMLERESGEQDRVSAELVFVLLVEAAP